MRFIIVLSVSLAVLAGCTAHQYDPPPPGVSLSGEAGVGVKYNDAKVTPVQNAKLKVRLGATL